jgi:hypothetical protein
MQQRKIPAVFMRGGTSNALMFHRHDLPGNADIWPELFIAALGANDPYGRQLDGMGGGISSLSKVCVISPSSRPGADIDYAFFQLAPTTDSVDLSASCGNMAAAVGPFAVDEGLVSSSGTEADVRIFSTNTGRMIHSTFFLDHGKAAVDGEMCLPGVAGLASPVCLEFQDLGGSATGQLLPTGKSVDEIETAGSKPISASMVDAGNPCVFVEANTLGLQGTEMPDELESNSEIMEMLEVIRCKASVAMGIARNIGEASRITGIPKVAFLSPAQDAITLAGKVVIATECDITVRMISLGQPHRAIPVTGALCMAVAAGIDGSLVKETLNNGHRSSKLRLAHPSGVASVDACLEQQGDSWYAKSATIYRTARRLMDGYVYVSAAYTPGLEEASGA